MFLTGTGATPAAGTAGRSGTGDQRKLLADVDPDRAPGDAPPATDAAGAAELVPPRGELVREPLAVPVCVAGAEAAAARDLREAAREAAVPLARRRRLGTVEIGGDHGPGAEAGRAHEGAVGAGETSLGDGIPARAVEVGEQAIVETLHLDRLAHPLPDRGDLPDRNGQCGVRPAGFSLRLASSRSPAGAVCPRDEATVDLGEDDVRARRHLRPGAHRSAEARRHGLRALNGDDEQVRAACGVVRIHRRATRQHPVVDGECGNVAGARADDGHWPCRQERPPSTASAPSGRVSTDSASTRGGNVHALMPLHAGPLSNARSARSSSPDRRARRTRPGAEVTVQPNGSSVACWISAMPSAPSSTTGPTTRRPPA